MHDQQTQYCADPAPDVANPDERQFQAFNTDLRNISSESREGPLSRMDAISLPMMQYLQQAGRR